MKKKLTPDEKHESCITKTMFKKMKIKSSSIQLQRDEAHPQFTD